MKGLSFVTELRLEESTEGLGMDIANHGEEAYTDGEGAVLLLDDEMHPSPTPAASQEAEPSIA